MTGRLSLARAVRLGATLLALLASAFWLSVRFGVGELDFTHALSEPGSPSGRILFSLRLPRAVLAALVGAALSSSGCVLQALMRNPLAEPFILGVSGGAALGATAAIALGFGSVTAVFGSTALGAWVSALGPSLFAFLGAVLATFGVLFGGARLAARTPHATLLLGVVFNAYAAAAVTGVKALSAPDEVAEILNWLAGALGYESVPVLVLAAAIQMLAIGTMWLFASRLNLLMLGDDEAASLGVEVSRARLVLLLATSLSVATAVALSGLVGFVGLLVPHVLRLWLGPDQRILVPASALGGAAFLLLADLGARLLFSAMHTEPPVGVITALLGGPVFVWLLVRGRWHPV